MSTWTHYRAQVATLSRSRTVDDPDLVEARRNLRAARLHDHIEKALADAPPLSEAQRLRIARLLTVAPVDE
jgi:hypothetical protein